MAIFFIIGFFVVTYFAHDLPDIDKLYEDQLKPSITILDEEGNLVATYGDIFTEYIEVKNMPPHLIDAVTATEDRRFYLHFGIDPIGLARAIYTNIKRGKIVQGGSTITQQLAKIVFLKPERSLKRKIQEGLLALWLEHKFTKDQILTMYLNRVYLGAGAYGVDAASRKYFGKPVANINIYEAAMLAGLLKAPTTYSPVNNLRQSMARTEQVLVNMVNADKLNEAQKNVALAKGTEIHRGNFRSGTRYFTDYVVDQIPEYIGNFQGKLIVTTTFDPNHQRFAEDAVTAAILANRDSLNATQAAFLAMKPSGAITAIVGGADYSESQYNRAVQAKRQPGSLFKLFVYMAALEDGKTPNSKVDDSPIKIGKWRPKNYDGKFHGIVTLKEALTKSYNVAAVVLSETIGRNQVIKLAQRMGVESEIRNMPSLALGANEVTLKEMVTAFAHLANKGRAVVPYTIEQIKTPDGENGGEILYQRQGDYDFRVLGVNATRMMNEMLVSVVEFGTGRGAKMNRDVAGKTGTSQNSRDAWFIGFTAQIVGGVWVGNDDNSRMNKVTGGGLPTKIWHEFMSRALATEPREEIDQNAYPEIEGTPWRNDNNTERQGFWDRILQN